MTVEMTVKSGNNSITAQN